MAFSAGVYTLPTPALVPGQTVASTENNTFRNDVATAFNLTMLRNGTSTATANLPMGGYKLTGLGAPTANGDALSYGNAAVVTSLTSTSLTATRVPYAGTGGLLQDVSTFTFDGTKLTVGGLKDSALTSGRVTYATTSGELTDSANLMFDGTTLTVNTLSVTNGTTITGGTANGVAYLNGSKVLTTGSALTFDGTNLGIGAASPSTGGFNRQITINSGAGSLAGVVLQNNSTGTAFNDGFSVGLNGLNVEYVNNENGYQSWFTNATEQMRLTSTGLGIGTSSPSEKLSVSGAAGYLASFTTTDANKPSLKLYVDDTDGAWIVSGYQTTARNLNFQTGGAKRMTLDSSGNLGLGVTPSAWSLGKAIELGSLGNSVWGIDNNDIALTMNAYYNAGWKYARTAAASYYDQNLGMHRWFTAPSGTSGNAISFTQAMTLDASGNLGIGRTPASNGRLDVENSADVYAYFRKTGGATLILYGGTSDSWVYTQTNHPLILGTNNTERARIDSSGNVGIGTSSPAAILETMVNASGGSVNAVFRNSNNGANTTKTITTSFRGADTASNSKEGSKIVVGPADQDWNGAYLSFYTRGSDVLTERMRIDSSGNVLVTSGVSYNYQPAPTSKAAAATLTGTELITGILNTTGTTYTITLPTGTNIDAAVSSSLAANGCFDWYVINTASGTITIGANGNTTLGSLTIATGVSARFRFRKTAANTYTVYRL